MKRFWDKVDVDADGGCWLWGAARGGNGYGQFLVGSRTDGSRQLLPAHRVAYEAVCGPIPEGLVIDHLCRVPSCVNPDHLEPVTPRENTLRGEGRSAKQARQTHCIHEHEFTPENTHIRKNGSRFCRACDRLRARRRRADRRAS